MLHMSQIMTRKSAILAEPSVQYIRSPLTRVGYQLVATSHHLLLMFSGKARIRHNSAGSVSDIEGPRLVWHVDGGDELVAAAGARASLVAIPGPALARAIPATPLGEQMRSTLAQNLSFPLDIPTRISTLIEGLDEERHDGAAGASLAATHLLSLILIQLWRLARADLIAHGRAPQGLAERFVLLASLHFREHWTVGRYARMLDISRDRLGSAVRQATGLSPQAYLHRELIREASELLANTGMPVGQVAFRLGFTDPAYFTRFFSRQAGATPASFRKTAKKHHVPGDESYAAWP